MEIIDTRSEYDKHFPDKSTDEGADNESIRSKALETALKTRKLEIELYWKRANYFWLFNAAIFAGMLFTKAHDTYYNMFFASNLGLVFSLGWFLVNKGSKYWQANWEHHVDALENSSIGTLYKMTKTPSAGCWVTNEGLYSVSKLNQIISLYVTFVWGVTFVITGLKLLSHATKWFSISRIEILNYFAMSYFILTLLFLFLLISKGKSEQPKSIKKVEKNNDKTKLSFYMRPMRFKDDSDLKSDA